MKKKSQKEVQPIVINQPIVDKNQQVEMQDPNIYNPNKKQQATPYYLSYMYAYGQRPVYSEPEPEIIVTPEPPKPFKAKRTFFVILIMILSLAILGTCVASGLGYMPLLNQFEGDGKENTPIGLDDIIKSTLKKFLSLTIEGDLIFYDEVLKDIETLEGTKLISTYMIIVTIIMTALMSLYVFIKSLSALKSKKRKKFGFVTLLTLIFAVGFLLMGFIWSGSGITGIIDYITGTSDSLLVGMGLFIIIGASLLLWVCSWFAYRKNKADKKARKLEKKAAKSQKKLAKAA